MRIPFPVILSLKHSNICKLTSVLVPSLEIRPLFCYNINRQIMYMESTKGGGVASPKYIQSLKSHAPEG